MQFKYFSAYTCTKCIINLQLGLQPIHQAALCGNAKLLDMLIEQFDVDPQEKADVSQMN